MSNNAPLAAQGSESGVVVEFVPSTALPSISGGIRVVALIGKGKTTKTILSKTVTRGSGSADTLTPAAASLPSNITDEDYVNYALGTDYALISGNIDWNTLISPASFTSTVNASGGLTLSGLTFILSVNGASPLTTLFTGSEGTSVSASSPATSTTSGDTLTLNINGDGAQTIVLATSASGAAVAADIQAKVRALTAFTPANQPAFNKFTAVYTTVYTLTSGVGGVSSSVVVTGGTAAPALKLGTGNGGTEVTGTASTSQSSIVRQLNQVLLLQATATAVGNFIKITNANAPGPVNTIQILGGTANTALGFTGGLIAKGPQQPALGTKYTFDYESAKLTADYAPKLYFDLQDMINDYGPVNTSNTLTLGAQLVFQNSANSGAIIGMQLDPADMPDLTGYQNALNKLLAVPNINIVVALTGDPNLYPAILGHVTNASAPLVGNFRTAIVGMTGSPSIPAATGFAAGFAAGGHGRRILLVYPPSATTSISTGEVTVDGSFIAAAIAGLRINSNFDVAEPLLRKQLQGLNAIPANLLRTQKLALRNGGVTVVETVNGIIRIMEDTTTDRATVDAENYSVTEIIDFVAETTQQTLNNLFIGIKLLTDTPHMIVTTLNLLLSTYVDLQIINGFTNVSATVNTLDPSQIDIAFDIAPVYPLRYISVKFSI